MSTDKFLETDRAKIKEVLLRHLSSAALDEEAMEALVQELSDARPVVADLVTEDDIAARMFWSIASCRTYRSEHKDIFPEPFARRVFWLRTDVENYFKDHWRPKRATRSTR